MNRRRAPRVSIAAGLLAVVAAVLPFVSDGQAAGAAPLGSGTPYARPVPANAAQPSSSAANYTPAPCNAAPKKPAGPAAAKPIARCYAMVRTEPDHQITPDAGAPPAGALGPADIQDAYNLPDTGDGQTVAIVDAYGASTAEADLATFRSHYGLPACTTANGCFRKVDQDGGTNYPGDDTGWAVETALDLDAVSAACPKCHILLVEANDPTGDNLGVAVDTAVSLGAKYVSNSYGVPGEFASEQAADHFYNHPGAVVTASTGDTGNVTNWPASNPNVVAVAGTRLGRDNSARGWSETAWRAGGSGCSPYEPKPGYQSTISTGCARRAIGDISADADPATGLAVYDSLGYSGWLQVGGTSLSSPLVAAMYALAGPPASGTYPVTYPYAATAGTLYDITSGTNGDCGDVLCQAGPGWDGPTGLGTPNGVAALTSGPHGDITGHVTDQGTGKPIAGAIVSTSPGGYSTTSGADGDYDLVLPPGTYVATATAYGYDSHTQPGLVVGDGQTATASFTLTAVPSHTLSGTVTDGSGHGWPLYAKVAIDGYPDGAVYTDPYTGHYSVRLPEQVSYALHVSAAVLPGYQTADVTAHVGAGDQSLDIAVPIDKAACTAPGYRFDGTTESFSGWNGSTASDGWTSVANDADGGRWQFDNPGSAEWPGSDPDFAITDAFQWSTADPPRDMDLTSAAVDLSEQSAPEFGFDTMYVASQIKQPDEQTGTVSVSVDGGRTWTTVWTFTEFGFSGRLDLPLPQAQGQSDVRLRFHYTAHSVFDNFWSIDNVFLGSRTCLPIDGGLVAGVLTDGNTGDAINGATIASVDRPSESGESRDTALPGSPSGYYTAFSSLTGTHQFTASDGRYTPATASVVVTANGVTRKDWTLGAGHLAVGPGSVSVTESLGTAKTAKVTLRNDGTAPTHITVGEQSGPFTPMAGLPPTYDVHRVKVVGKVTPLTAPVEQTGGANLPGATPADPSWTPIADYPSPIFNNAVARDDRDGKVYSVGGSRNGGGEYVANGYVYDPASQRWSAITNAPKALVGAAATFINGKMYLFGGLLPNASVTAAVYSYDPLGNSWSRLADMPQPSALARVAVLDGQVYVIGGCVDFVCHSSAHTYRYNPGSDTWVRLADYPNVVADGACAGLGSEVVCAGGGQNGQSLDSTLIYHPGTDTWVRGADMPYDAYGMAFSGANGKLQVAGGFTAGLGVTDEAAEYNPATDRWRDLPSTNTPLYGAGSACGLYQVGGFDPHGPVTRPDVALLAGYDQCATGPSWLSTSNSDVQLAPGESATVTITLNSVGLTQPGDYAGSMWIDTDTPYRFAPVEVSLHVTPPSTWGKISGSVADATSGAALAGATVVICTMYDKHSGACGPVTYTFKTDESGRYQLWLNKGYSPLQVSAAKDGYEPSARLATITSGATTTVDFALKRS